MNKLNILRNIILILSWLAMIHVKLAYGIETAKLICAFLFPFYFLLLKYFQEIPVLENLKWIAVRGFLLTFVLATSCLFILATIVFYQLSQFGSGNPSYHLHAKQIYYMLWIPGLLPILVTYSQLVFKKKPKDWLYGILTSIVMVAFHLVFMTTVYAIPAELCLAYGFIKKIKNKIFWLLLGIAIMLSIIFLGK